MGAKNGRQKGSKAEREVAALLQAWWLQLEPCEFVRTPLSGGWGGPTLRAGFGAAGDLMTTARCFPFCVEVKRREGWSYRNLVAGGMSPVWAWWEQARIAAAEGGQEPLLLLRRNNEDWHVMLRYGLQRSRLPGVWQFWTGAGSHMRCARPEDIPKLGRLDSLLAVPPSTFALPRTGSRARRGA